MAEYWIADPLARTVEALRLSGERYRSLGVFTRQAQLPSAVAPGLPVPVERFFA